MKNIGRITGNALTRDVKRRIISNSFAKTARNNMISETAVNSGLTVACSGLTNLHYMNNNSAGTVCFLLSTAVGSLVTGLNCKNLFNAFKENKQTKKCLKTIVNESDYPNIVNRYMRIKGKKELSPKEIFKACNKVTVKELS